MMISVIIPNYNHSPFLKERIESVLHQTFDDFEVIILDDCSTDNSRDIINQYRNHPKVNHIVFNKENSGSTFKQWKKGFELARGEYVWIAESDDVAHPDFLKKIMLEFEKYPRAVLAFSSMIRINEKSENQGIINLTTRGTNPIDGIKFIRNNMLFGCHILNASSAVFKRESLDKISNTYQYFKASGDYLFWTEIAKTGYVLKVNEGLDYFRHHSNKVTPQAVATGVQFEEVHKIIEIMKAEGYISSITMQVIAGFWQRKIRKCKTFNSQSIKNKCKSIWRLDTFHPFITEALYLVFGSYRYFKKIINL